MEGLLSTGLPHLVCILLLTFALTFLILNIFEYFASLTAVDAIAVAFRVAVSVANATQTQTILGPEPNYVIFTLKTRTSLKILRAIIVNMREQTDQTKTE